MLFMSIAKRPLIANIKGKENSPLVEVEDNQATGKNPLLSDVSEIKRAGHKNIPLAKVIRKKCLECCCFQPGEVRKCHITDCALWPYRMSKNPFHSAKMKGK